MNKVGLRLTGKSTDSDVNPLATHCALLGSCFCSKNDDCGPNQICTPLFGYDKYLVCQTKNEVAPVSFDRSIFPVPFGFLSYLVSDVPTLVKAVISNCSLLDAAATVGGLIPTLLPVDKALETVATLGDQLGGMKSLADVGNGVNDVVKGILP